MNKIPIVMPTYNRSQYLVQVLEGLSKCENLDKFFIVTSEEPDCPEVSALFDKVDFIKIVRWKNEEKLGCNKNVIQAINFGFDCSDVVVVLEDDIVPGRDFLNYFLWGFENIKPENDIIALAAYNKSNYYADSVGDKVYLKNLFTPWGWGTWRSVWQSLTDLGDKIVDERAAWDLNLNDIVLEKNLKVIYPYIGRVQNIGEVGADKVDMKSPEFHKRYRYCYYWIENKDILPIKDFVLIDYIKHYYFELDGWFDFEDIYKERVYYAQENAHFVELGAFLGKSTSYMGVEIHNSNKNIKFDVIDIFQDTEQVTEKVSKNRQENETILDVFLKNTERIKHTINKVHVIPSIEAVKLYEDESIDFMFIDANHEYESIKEDIETWLPKIKLGGYIGGHDYHKTWPGVIQAVNAVIGEHNIKTSNVSWLFHKSK